ncbi:MAG: hypothetical protein QM783_15235 [Phycisphaerales bacterium]
MAKKAATTTNRRRGAESGGLTARTADRYALYQTAVQEPEPDLDFLDRVYRKRFGALPASLREDFAGTALTASEWVKRRASNTAVAVDLDPVPLAWFDANIAPKMTPAQRARLTILRDDVMSKQARTRDGYDAIFAFNFSYWIFKQRATMLDYFRSVRASLGTKGLFLLDHFAGSETMEEVTDRTRKKGFTYVWDQKRFDPISGNLIAEIGFEFKDGTKWPGAFHYDWRLWTIPELRDVLNEAGFAKVEVYMEKDDKNGVGTGVYVLRRSAPADRALISYIVAEP